MATIKDIAQRANVSSAAVSRILNEDDTLSVSPQTKQNVLKIASELQYIKKAKPKKAEPIKTIGIVQWYSLAQELEDTYYFSVRMGAENYCKEQGILVKRTFKNDLDYLSNLHDIDGLICIGKFSKKDIEQFRNIHENVIFVDMMVDHITQNCVVLDFESAIKDAMSYLCELGHTHIGYLGGKEFTSDDTLYEDSRRNTFFSYCKEHQIKHFLMEEQFSIESGYHMMKQLIENRQCPDALLCANDSIALGAIRACNEFHIQVPEDISIIGFNDISASAYSTPPLTTIHAPSEVMGEYAASFIDQQIGKLQKLPIKFVLPCTLIKRASCKEKN